MIRLTKNQVVSIHSALISATGAVMGFVMMVCLSLLLSHHSKPLTEQKYIRHFYKKPQDLVFPWLQTILSLTETSE